MAPKPCYYPSAYWPQTWGFWKWRRAWNTLLSLKKAVLSFSSEDRLKWTSVIVLPSFHAFLLSSRDHSFATPSPRGLGKVDSIPSNQGQSQGIPSMGMNAVGIDTDQSQSHQSQSLELCFNSCERDALFWLRSLSWESMGLPSTCPKMKGTQRAERELNNLFPRHWVAASKDREQIRKQETHEFAKVSTHWTRLLSISIYVNFCYFQNVFDFSLLLSCRSLSTCSF